MSKRGYEKDTVVGSLAGGGTLGLLIPPSLSFIIYGALTETSIGKLFAAGIIPGFLVAAMFMLYLLLKCIRNPAIAPRDPNVSSFWEIFVGFKQIWPLLALIFSVIGTIVGGLATPTEAAGVGVVLAVVISTVWGDLTFTKLIDALYNSVLLFSSVGFLGLGRDNTCSIRQHSWTSATDIGNGRRGWVWSIWSFASCSFDLFGLGLLL
jgi:tripartite ATP-independent transporter DctM subunit